MSIFAKIDEKLEALAHDVNAVLTRDRNSTESDFEERRIDWIDNGIKKAIIIQPTFTANGIDNSRWNFFNLAWTLENGMAQKPTLLRTLIFEADFGQIEEQIDSLISQSQRNLMHVTLDEVIAARKKFK